MGQNPFKSCLSYLCPDTNRHGSNTYEKVKTREVDSLLLAPVKPSRVPEQIAYPFSKYLIRIAFVGEIGVGKTSIVTRYVNNYFEPETYKKFQIKESYVDFSFKNAKVGGKQIKILVWDTTGYKKFGSAISHYMHGADIVALVYATNEIESFEKIKNYWAGIVQNNAPKTAHLLLLGNKSDLAGSLKSVSSMEAQDYASTFRDRMSSFELSAKTGHNVDLAMLHGLRIALAKQLKTYEYDSKRNKNCDGQFESDANLQNTKGRNKPDFEAKQEKYQFQTAGEDVQAMIA